MQVAVPREGALSVYKAVSLLVTFAVALMLGGAAFAAAQQIEAENMQMPAEGSIIRYSTAASGGMFVSLHKNRTISTSFSGAVDKLTVRAKGRYYSGAWPQIVVKVDGTSVLSGPVDSSTFQDFTVDLPTDIADGNHTLSVSFTNDYYYRNLDVDAVSASAAEVGAAEALPPPDGGGAALGVFAGQDGGDGGTWETSTLTAVHAFERQVGAKPKMVHMFYSWYTDLGCAAFPPGPTTAIREGYAPLLTWEYSRYRAADRAYNYAAINAGTHDTCIRDFARGAAAGGTVYLRPFHEMNGDWYGWSVAANGNTPASHVAAWRRVVDIFRAEGANNVKFVWCPNVRFSGDAGPYANYYPGDAYVDYLCLDGYNWGSANGSPWQSFDQIYRSSYNEITALPSSDPVIIGEYASNTGLGDKAQWINDMRATVKSGAYPRLKVLTSFNQDRDNATWQVDSSQAVLDAYKAFAADPYYKAEAP